MDKYKHIDKLQTLENEDFWKYVVQHKSELLVVLDHDDTWVMPDDCGDFDYSDIASAGYYLGNGDGIMHLLSALGISWEHSDILHTPKDGDSQLTENSDKNEREG